MVARTFGDVKEQLKRVAGQSGLRVDDARLVEYTNLAVERLLAECENPVGSLHRIKLCQYDRILALPSAYERLVKFSVDRGQVPVVNSWYEFLDYGPGHQDKISSVNVAIDRGESPIIRDLPSAGVLIRAYSYADERVDAVRPKIKVYGYDQYGVWVRTETEGVWSDGIELELRGDAATNYHESTVKFSKISSVVKPVTNGVVELHAIDEYGTTALLGRYSHKETNPSYRIYFAPGIDKCEGSVVHAVCRVRYQDIKSDSDLMLITSLPALRIAMRAIALEDSDKALDALALWRVAASILHKEAKHYYGSANPPVDVTAAGVAFGGIPNA